MNGDYILDSNIVINIFRNDVETIQKVSELKNIYIPVIVLGELHYGANKSNQTKKRTLEIEQLKRRVIILEINDKTAELYGEIKNQLRQKGRLIPENDIWIAAIAKEIGLPILTNDKHFLEVDQIKVVAI
ncbi:MAG: type II toxin-antitoxin system VapC family toxin [Bacteroidota bacterium]